MPGSPPSPSFAFVGWNPFQLRLASPVARELPGGCMVVECRKQHPFHFSPSALDGSDLPWLGWPAGELARLDGLFDVIVCQTVFPGLERIERSRVAMLQYGLAKEPYNYGAWRAMADLHLAYGSYSASRLGAHAPAVAVGQPAMDRRYDPHYARRVRAEWAGRLDPSKATVAYVPTWGALSTSDAFATAVRALSDRYNVVLKLHHNTAMLERGQRRALREVSPYVVDGTVDLLDVLTIADVVLSDYSGAIFDAIHCDLPVVLLQTDSASRFGDRLDAESIEYRLREDLGRVVRDPAELGATVDAQLSKPKHPPAELVESLFERGPGASVRAANALRALAAGRGPTPTEAQRTARRRERDSRRTDAGAHRRWKPAELVRRLRRLGPSPATDSTRGSKVPASRGASFEERALGEVTRFLASRFGYHVNAALLHAHRCTRTGAHAEGRRTLLLAQRGCAGDPRLLLAIADSYRDDARPDIAHAFYRAAAVQGGTYEAVRKLSFESDWERTDRGSETLRSLLRESPHALLPWLPMLNRVSVRYPEHTTALQELRRSARAVLRRHLSSGESPERWLDLAIRCRWTQDIRSLQSKGRRVLRPAIRAASERAGRVLHALGPMADVLDAAWENENAPDMRCVHGGDVVPLSTVDARPVELFIPGAFFAFDANEKPTYATVRRAFRNAYEHLSKRPDVCIVPRMQTHWKACRSRLEGHRISYHTSGLPDPTHLRIQESPLAGRCSFDPAGYAGYGSLGLEGHTGVDAFAEGRSPADVAETRATLRRTYVESGRSKYAQSAQLEALPSRYVFVPLQLRTDDVARLAYIDQLRMLDAAVERLEGTGLEVVVKRHPYCKSASVDAALAACAEKVTIARGSVHALIASSEAVLTVNSGTGLEALLHGRPVIATGRSDYGRAARVCETVAELGVALGELAAGELRAPDPGRFLDYYFHRYTLDPSDAEAIGARLDEWLDGGGELDGPPATARHSPATR